MNRCKTIELSPATFLAYTGGAFLFGMVVLEWAAFGLQVVPWNLTVLFISCVIAFQGMFSAALIAGWGAPHVKREGPEPFNWVLWVMMIFIAPFSSLLGVYAIEQGGWASESFGGLFLGLGVLFAFMVFLMPADHEWVKP